MNIVYCVTCIQEVHKSCVFLVYSDNIVLTSYIYRLICLYMAKEYTVMWHVSEEVDIPQYSYIHKDCVFQLTPKLRLHHFHRNGTLW